VTQRVNEDVIDNAEADLDATDGRHPRVVPPAPLTPWNLDDASSWSAMASKSSPRHQPTWMPSSRYLRCCLHHLDSNKLGHVSMLLQLRPSA
jgi:hypothetical protein